MIENKNPSFILILVDARYYADQPSIHVAFIVRALSHSYTTAQLKLYEINDTALIET